MQVRRTSDGVDVELTEAEAIVLFELLHRWEDEDLDDAEWIAHPAERRVLWDLSAGLEPMIDLVFSPEYPTRLRQARNEVGVDDAECGARAKRACRRRSRG